MGVLLWRGFTIDNIMAQCFGNEEDGSGKGRQMPVVCFLFLKNTSQNNLERRSILARLNITFTQSRRR